jgi:hypothetical protein
MKRLLTILFSAGTCLAAAQTAPVQYPRLSKTLDSLAYVDQWPMQRMLQRQPDTLGRDLVAVEKANYARHQPVLERIVRQYGFPGFRQVGQTSSHNFWLLVQHADAHPEFQRAVLGLMKREVARKNASAANYAYLVDRIATNAGQLQEYGTQLSYAGPGIGQAQPRPLRDPQNVDKRRAALGVEPLADYLRTSNMLHQQMNTPQPKN